MRTLWLTQEDNVKNKKVIDNNKVIRMDYSNHCIVTVDDGFFREDIDIASISLFNHKLIIDGKKYYILYILSKG